MSGLSQYVKDVSRVYQRFTREKELELADRKDRGDIEARDLLVTSCLPLVVKYAKNFVQNENHLQDLIQVGNLALLGCIGKFDPRTYGTRLTTYATWWIRRGILDALKKQPLSCGVVSLDEAVAKDVTRGDAMLASHESLPEEKGYHEDCCHYVMGLLEDIPCRQAYVLRRRLLRKQGENTLKIIGEALDPPVGRERIRQLAASARMRMLHLHQERREEQKLQDLGPYPPPQLLGDNEFLLMLDSLELGEGAREWPIPKLSAKQKAHSKRAAERSRRCNLAKARGRRVA